MPDLNFAERFLLSRVVIGLSYQEIMDENEASWEGLKAAIEQLYRKTGTSSHYQLKLWALQNQKEIFGYQFLKGGCHANIENISI